MPPRLSKSKILSGLQCAKRLWLEVHQPDAAHVSGDVQRRFDIGHAVNDVARSLYENGRLIEWAGDGTTAIAHTKAALEASSAPVFEATFAHRGVLIRVDILTREKHGYRLIEVKSSTGVKPPYYPDCAVQAWVLEGNGLPLERVELAHIDNQFVYRGEHDYRGLFRYEDLGGDIAELKSEVPHWVDQFQQVLQGRVPDIEVGDHCKTPYPCPFIAHCSGPGTEYPISLLPRAGGIIQALTAEGIHDLRDIPAGRLHNETHEWVRAVTKTGRADLNPAVKERIGALPCPRYYLDFETVRFAVPVWEDTRPYQALPFQWSCHVETGPGRLAHREFLDTTGAPPMRRFIESLLEALENSGPILVYSAYEKTCLQALAARFPDLEKAIQPIIARLVDLLPITRQHYYHPDMRGSWSLKAVLPTIAPELDYGDLGEVQDGGAAEAAYLEIIHPDTGRERAQTLAADLRNYCQRDTEALVALVRFLHTGKIGAKNA